MECTTSRIKNLKSEFYFECILRGHDDTCTLMHITDEELTASLLWHIRNTARTHCRHSRDTYQTHIMTETYTGYTASWAQCNLILCFIIGLQNTVYQSCMELTPHEYRESLPRGAIIRRLDTAEHAFSSNADISISIIRRL